MIRPAVAILLSLGAVTSMGARAEPERFVVEDGSWRLEDARPVDPTQRFRVQGAISPAQAPAAFGPRLKLAGTLGPQSTLACLASDDGIFQDSFEEQPP